MLGSASEAEDAVQETWLRLARSDPDTIDNLGGWLTTVVARICLDKLRARKARREEPMSPDVPEPVSPSRPTRRRCSPTRSASRCWSCSIPSSRPSASPSCCTTCSTCRSRTIAPIVGRTPAAARQLASRARRRVRGAEPEAATDIARRRDIVEAFLAASRSGDMEGLLRVLDPDVVFRPDAVAQRMGNVGEIRGAEPVAAMFKGRAQAAKTALIDGAVGVAVAFDGQLRIAMRLTFAGDRIAGIEAIADPERLGELTVTAPAA